MNVSESHQPMEPVLHLRKVNCEQRVSWGEGTRPSPAVNLLWMKHLEVVVSPVVYKKMRDSTILNQKIRKQASDARKKKEESRDKKPKGQVGTNCKPRRDSRL